MKNKRFDIEFSLQPVAKWVMVEFYDKNRPLM